MKFIVIKINRAESTKFCGGVARGDGICGRVSARSGTLENGAGGLLVGTCMGSGLGMQMDYCGFVLGSDDM
jgi:hypothetical protein